MKNEDKRDETKLNPFDRQVTDLQLVREEMTEIAEKNDFKMDDFVRIVKIYERICEELTEIAEDSTVPTMRLLLSDISVPFAEFIMILNKKTPEDLRILNINVITRKISKLMQTVADRIAEPFNSEDLKEWFPLIKSLLTSEQHTLRDCGAQFWKKSFGTVKAQLIYPDDLRTILLGMAEEHCIHIPPESRLDSTSENQDLIPPLEDRPNENVQEISPPDTQFNPFDRQVTDLQLVRNEKRTQLISVDQFSRNLINLEGNLDAIRIYLNDQYRGIMMPQLMLNRFLVRHRATVRNGRLIITSVVFLELEGIRFRFLFEVNWSFHVEIFQILILSFVHFLRFE